MMTKIKLGNIIIYITIAITLILWLIFQFRLEEFPSLVLLQLNQITALIGTLLLSWSMLLMTRLNFLEKLFGGLDKVYKAHKNVSIWGMVMITIHALSLAIDRIPNFSSAIKMFVPVHNQMYINLGIWSFWIFVVLVLIAIFMKEIRLPYHIWKYIHKATGIALILAFFHIILLPGNITSSPILNIWLLLTLGTGIASWIYYEFFYKILAPSYKYQVSEIIKSGDVFKIQLKPIDKRMAYKPGQFAYLSFMESELSRELHPFTMTSHPNENKLTFAIKILGDYTKTLDKLKVNDIAHIWGPYGDFADKFLESDQDVIFIGGGIGIAPFLSMLKEDSVLKNRNSSLFYCTKYKSDACFDTELSNLSKDKPNFYYLNKCSREESRLTVAEILDRVDDIQNTLVFICGPSRLNEPIVDSLISLGFPKNNIVSEDFGLL